jgi:type I restriction enzyme S subunit
MKLMPEFKQTEVGMIPNDWVLKSFAELFEFSGGYSASREQLSESGYCYLHYGDIHGSSRTCIDIDVEMLDIPRLNIPLKKVSSRSLLKDGDVVFVDASEDDAGTSKHVVIINERNTPFISGLHTIVAKSKADDLVRDYKKYCFQSATIRGQFLFYSVGTKVSGISKSNIAKLFLPVPSRIEQQNIAATLSDIDELLNSLNSLIVKKRDLKEATIQKLLTGQIRLPSFDGKWTVKKLGELGSTYGGLTGKTKVDFGEGSARYITFMNVMKNVVIDCNTFDRVAISSNETQNRVVKGDLFFNGSSETPEEVAMCSVLLEEVEGVYLNSFCFGFRLRERADADGVFLAYYFRSQEGRELMKSLAQGSTRYNLSKVALLNSSMHLPPLDEQIAIATILSDMDSELVSLETQSDKIAVLKQGMMQELLTGRMRLL